MVKCTKPLPRGLSPRGLSIIRGLPRSKFFHPTLVHLIHDRIFTMGIPRCCAVCGSVVDRNGPVDGLRAPDMSLVCQACKDSHAEKTKDDPPHPGWPVFSIPT